MRWLDGITNTKDRSLNKLQKIVEDRRNLCVSPWGPQNLKDLVTEQQQLKQSPALQLKVISHNCWFYKTFIFTAMPI